jgi:hypothetical protein
MLIGAHSIIFSKDAEADRVFLRDVLKLTHVDAGDGWLIFGLPAAEVAIHPSEKNDSHEFYFMVDDVETFVARMKEHRIACSPVQNQDWGLLTRVTLPGGGHVGVYEPRHSRPKTMSGQARFRRSAQRSTKTGRNRAREKSRER